MRDVHLVFPTDQMESSVLAFKKEFFDNNERIINGSNRLDMDKYSFSEWLQLVTALNNAPVNLEAGFSHTFFAVSDEGEPIGIVNIRHPLTGLFADAGHIGYSVRPSERNKGVATEILRQMLVYAKKQGVLDVHLVCKKENAPSKRTIQKNGGLLIRAFVKNQIEYEEYRIV